MYNISSFHPGSVSALGPTDGNKEPSHPPLPWRLIAVVLGVLCLGLLVALSVLISLFLQASNEMAEQNKTLLKQQEIRNNHTQLQESLKNCMQRKKDLQDQYNTLADALKKKEETCGHCAKSWIQHGERCYHFSKKMRTWPDSKKYCSSQGSSLLKIGDKEELGFITGLACMHWIGLSHKNISYSWTWEDGAVHSTHLFPLRPVQDGGTCALFHTGNALAYNCAEDFRCICEKPAA
ncbi:oxidized low-density lipoprotein receptor 1-like [Alligator sinensis]|uniref:Oxidized low-density lipoprotein receptor 1-like n=1 Tax=Alligator sinensis TaxID=38654 RepID=A0A3Q0FP13_ALLSI|nr:oxidized low-density lipoprotein receptor 1-like [Alligator sinensis]